MSDQRGKKYYDYLKKYDAEFLNKYESWSHHHWGRRSNFLQLLYYKAYSLNSGRPIVASHYKLKSPFVIFGGLICLFDLFGVWFWMEIYNKHYPWKWVVYMPHIRESHTPMEDDGLFDTTDEKRPMTRLKYSDAIKLVYNGKEEQDVVGMKRLRYR